MQKKADSDDRRVAARRWFARDDPRVADHVASVGVRLNNRLHELTSDIRNAIEEELPALRGDERAVGMLDASVQENVDTMLHILGQRIELAGVEPPTAAVEYARRLAQHDVALVALIRAYRVGQTRFLRRCIEDLLRHTEGDHVEGAATLEMVERASEYIDQVVEGVIRSYEQAREDWMEHRSALLAIRVRSVLRERGSSIEALQAKLGAYRIGQHHLGAVLWWDGSSEGDPPLARLGRLADALANSVESLAPQLFVPADDSCAWLWLPLGTRATVDHERLERVLAVADPALFAAFGEPAPSLDGFRRTHHQAMSAHAVALATGTPQARCTAFADVAPIAMMSSDLDSARAWVGETLGALAVDDERHAVLRETARVFLTSGGSYTATADQLILHRNTAQYRIRKAEELRGRPFREGRLDVELALLACHWLGRAVLQPAPP
jgi:hypothetical protein